MFPVEAFQSTLGKAAAIFWQLRIRFHLTGGETSVLYGEPRMTQSQSNFPSHRSSMKYSTSRTKSAEASRLS